MTIVTPEEIAQYRSALVDNPEALAALDIIENCEGNLEDAAEVIAIEAGEDEVQSNLLDKVIQRCRHVVCKEDLKEDVPVMVAAVTEYLVAGSGLPPGLATPFVIFVTKKGLKNFCKSADSN